MDRPSDISAYTEQAIAVDSVKHQNTEVIQTVANRLTIIGDELSLSYQDLSCSSLKKFKSCATLEGCLNILLSVLKAWNWKFKQIAEAKPSSEMHGKKWKQGTISLNRFWSQCTESSSNPVKLLCMDGTRLKRVLDSKVNSVRQNEVFFIKILKRNWTYRCLLLLLFANGGIYIYFLYWKTLHAI